MRALLERYDVLALPVSQVVPFPVESRVAARDRRRPDGLLPRVDALVLAHHRHRASRDLGAGRLHRPTGLPVGLQLVGRQRGERALLRLAAAIERATGFGRRAPDL